MKGSETSHDSIIHFSHCVTSFSRLILTLAMPTENRNRHKVCHCTPNCNRLLGISQRKHHYQLVDDPSTIRRSTTPSDSEEAPSIDDAQPDISENKSAENMHIGPDGPYEDDDFGMGDISRDIEEVPLRDNYDDRDNGQESGDGFFDGQDDETWEYDPEDEFNEPLLSLDEMQEAIEDEIGSEMDLEMWALRESCCNE
jgi:hypothetical protein